MHVELTKEFRFEAAHCLPMVPPGHKCHRLHGHSFRIDVTVAGEVDTRTGWLVDYADIAAVVDPVLRGELDHRTLNDVRARRHHRARDLHGALHLPRGMTVAAARRVRHAPQPLVGRSSSG